VAILFIIIIIICVVIFLKFFFTHFMSFFFITLDYFASVPCFSYRSNLFAPFSFLDCDNLCPLTNRKTILSRSLLLFYTSFCRIMYCTFSMHTCLNCRVAEDGHHSTRKFSTMLKGFISQKAVTFVYLFCGLFTDAVNVSDCITSSVKFSEYQM
jgi:hypothetical protein